jgi:hypothetical protein
MRWKTFAPSGAFSLGLTYFKGLGAEISKNSNEAAWRFLSQYCLSPVKTVQPILSSVVSRKFGVNTAIYMDFCRDL